MNYWIIPANPNKYDLFQALRDLPAIDWRQHNNFEVGDFIFIYTSRPYSRIHCMMEVMDVNLPASASIFDGKYWKVKSEYDVSLNLNRFMRLHHIADNESDQLTLEDLCNHGLKAAPQGAVKVKEPLLQHLRRVFDL